MTPSSRCLRSEPKEGERVMNSFPRVRVAVALVLPLVHVGRAAEPVDSCFSDLPPGCSITRSYLVSGVQRSSIAQKLGTPLSKLSNTFLKVNGASIRVNIMETRTAAEAATLHKVITAMKGNPVFCLLRGQRVIEFCRTTPSTAIRTAYELGFVQKPARVRYRVTAQLATVEQADYMSLNELSNVFFKANTRTPGADSKGRVEELLEAFSFGRTLSLRSDRAFLRPARYVFRPPPRKTVRAGQGTARYEFEGLPAVLGVPSVQLQAEISCNSSGQTPADRSRARHLLVATDHWPVNDPEVQALEITAGKETQADQIQAILRWLQPNRNIASSGKRGSRWGVKRVLGQRYGHCWDSSDCFVTLCRATGIPARQVGGWLFGGCGHVWAEVLMEGKTWQQVDPTGGGRVPCGVFHIPYFTTETGDMPILYLSMPEIEILETR